MLQPPPAHRNDPSGHSGVPLGLFGKPKRSSSSRFAAFGGRGSFAPPFLRTGMFFQNIPVFRMAYFTIKPYYGLISKTLMLQVRSAHPPMPHRTSSSSCSGVPHGLFMISHHRPCGRWCFARLIRQAETLELQLHSQPPSKRTALSELKRSCFRFAPLTLRCRTEMFFQNIPVFRSAYFPIPHRPTFGAPVFRSAYSASRNARASAAFAASIKPYYGLCSKALDLQVRSAHPPMPHRNDPSGHSGVPLGLFGKPKRTSSSRFAAFGGRGSFAPPAPPSPAPADFRKTDRHSLWVIFC